MRSSTQHSRVLTSKCSVLAWPWWWASKIPKRESKSWKFSSKCLTFRRTRSWMKNPALRFLQSSMQSWWQMLQAKERTSREACSHQPAKRSTALALRSRWSNRLGMRILCLPKLELRLRSSMLPSRHLTWRRIKNLKPWLKKVVRKCKKPLKLPWRNWTSSHQDHLQVCKWEVARMVTVWCKWCQVVKVKDLVQKEAHLHTSRDVFEMIKIALDFDNSVIQQKTRLTAWSRMGSMSS